VFQYVPVVLLEGPSSSALYGERVWCFMLR
jgi:hypothetical protein